MTVIHSNLSGFVWDAAHLLCNGCVPLLLRTGTLSVVGGRLSLMVSHCYVLIKAAFEFLSGLLGPSEA